MRRQIYIFILLQSVLLLYTAFKFSQALHLDYLLAVLLTLPIFFLMFGSLFIARSKPESTEKTWFHIFSKTGLTIMGFWSVFIIFSIPLDLTSELAIFFGSIFNIKWIDSDQIIHFNYQVTQIIFYISIGITLFGFFEVLRGPKVKKVIVSHPSINKDLHEFKIIQISDLHIGHAIKESYVRKVVDLVNAENPDLIVVTGDLIDAHISSVIPSLKIFSELKAKHGN